MLNNAKIGKRLGIGFAFAILVTIVLSIIAINSFIDSKGRKYYEYVYKPI